MQETYLESFCVEGCFSRFSDFQIGENVAS